MNFLKKSKIKEIKPILFIAVLLLFPFYWVHAGFDIVKNLGWLSEFITEHAGLESIFTWDALEFAIFYFALMVYPIYLSWIIIAAFYDKGMVIVFLNKQWVLYSLISPPLIVLGIILLFLGRILIGTIIWSLFIGYPLYLLIKWIAEKFSLVSKTD